MNILVMSPARPRVRGHVGRSGDGRGMVPCVGGRAKEFYVFIRSFTADVKMHEASRDFI
jgi:hypothetical protein